MVQGRKVSLRNTLGQTLTKDDYLDISGSWEVFIDEESVGSIHLETDYTAFSSLLLKEIAIPQDYDRECTILHILQDVSQITGFSSPKDVAFWRGLGASVHSNTGNWRFSIGR